MLIALQVTYARLVTPYSLDQVAHLYLSQAAKVVLCHSYGNAFEIIAAAPVTAQTNLITSTRVYAVYPTLVTGRKALRSDHSFVSVCRKVPINYNSQQSNRNWMGPCGSHCPAAPRKTVGDEGIASFHWNGRYDLPESRVPGCDSLLADSPLYWQFSAACRNRHCNNYASRPASHIV